MKNSPTITRATEERKQVMRTIGAMFQDSLKATAPGQVGDVDPQRAEELTRAMIGAGLLVPVKYGQTVLGLSFLAVEAKNLEIKTGFRVGPGMTKKAGEK